MTGRQCLRRGSEGSAAAEAGALGTPAARVLRDSGHVTHLPVHRGLRWRPRGVGKAAGPTVRKHARPLGPRTRSAFTQEGGVSGALTVHAACGHSPPCSGPWNRTVFPEGSSTFPCVPRTLGPRRQLQEHKGLVGTDMPCVPVVVFPRRPCLLKPLELHAEQKEFSCICGDLS